MRYTCPPSDPSIGRWNHVYPNGVLYVREDAPSLPLGFHLRSTDPIGVWTHRIQLRDQTFNLPFEVVTDPAVSPLPLPPLPTALSVTVIPSPVRVGQTLYVTFSGLRTGEQIALTEITYPNGTRSTDQRTYLADSIEPFRIAQAGFQESSALGTYVYKYLVRGQTLTATFSVTR